MATVVSHGLLALAVAALAAGSARLASALGVRGLDRLLAAIAFAAAAAVAQALVLGLVGLGGSAPALAVLSVAAWAGVRALVSPDGPTVRDELLARLRSASGWALAAAGGAAGAWLAFTVWSLHEPALGFDAVLYHVPEAVGWVEGGTPGSVQDVVGALPVGNYPVTLEVLLAWGMGLSSSLVPVTLAGCAAIGLTGLATWAGLRRLSVPPPAAAAGAAALVALPAVLTSLSNGWSTDPVALAWVAVCGALCAGALSQPALLAPAVVAGGLAIGTKTTALPMAAALLALTAFALRRELRPRAGALAAASALALIVGATWYVRNLIDHGSPLWPFVTTSFGDPAPPVIALGDVSFLDRPRATFDGLRDYYRDTFAAGIVLVGGALIAPFVVRTRAVAAAAVATGASVVLWMGAPGTGSLGSAFDIGTGDATRYLLPGLVPAVLALALASRAGGARGAAATAVLAAAAAVGLAQAPGVGEARLPSVLVPLAGAAAGALAAWAAARLAGERPAVVRLGSPALAVAVLAIGTAVAAGGYLERHTATDRGFEGDALERLAADARYRDGSEPVASTFSEIGVLAGDRLRHRLDLIPPREPCAALRARRRDGWVVVPLRRTDRRDAVAIERCLGASAAAYRDPAHAVWAPRGG